MSSSSSSDEEVVSSSADDEVIILTSADEKVASASDEVASDEEVVSSADEEVSPADSTEESEYDEFPERNELLPYPIRNYTVYNNRYQPSYTWKISQMYPLLKQKNCVIHSCHTFVWDDTLQVEARANLVVSSSEMVSMWLDLFPGPHAGPTRDITSIPTVYYVLVDCHTNRRHIVRSCHTPFGTTFDYSLTFKRDLFPESFLASPLYNVKDSVIMRVYVAWPEKLYSYNGVLNWTVEEFQKTKRASEVSEGDESRYFCTHKKGYVAQAQLTYYNNNAASMSFGSGSVKKDSLRVRIAFWWGKFDDYLLRTFPHLTNITLMNPEYPFSMIENTIRGNSVFEFDDWHITLNDDRIIDAESLEISVEIKLHVSLMVASLMDFQLGNGRPRGPNSNKFCLYTFRD